jgi:hypothetical protein
MRTLGVALIVMMVLMGCAGSRDASPSAMIAPPPDPAVTGVWQGTVTSRDFATALGTVDGTAILTLEPDGRWTLIERYPGSEIRSSGTARMVGSRLILDGHIDRGSGAGARVTHVVRFNHANRLSGQGETFFLGHRVGDSLDVRRQPS